MKQKTVRDLNIKVGDKFFSRYMKGYHKPYEVAKDGGSIWYFVLFDGSGSDIVRIWKDTTTIEEFEKIWSKKQWQK